MVIKIKHYIESIDQYHDFMLRFLNFLVDNDLRVSKIHTEDSLWTLHIEGEVDKHEIQEFFCGEPYVHLQSIL